MNEQSSTGNALRYGAGGGGAQRPDYGLARPAPRDSLVDLLDRVLDKGVVIAGDISIKLLDIELLTIKIRLLIASVDKAKEMGIDWWAHDPQLSGDAKRRERTLDSERENKELRSRIDDLESRLSALLEKQEQRPSRPAAALPAVGRGARRGDS
jgi:hypothetical protein